MLPASVAAAAGKRIAVALSGGVDSTVTALLLKQKGYNLLGVYMRNWDERDESGHCHGDEEWNQVKSVCNRLDIDCVQVNFVREYWTNVFEQLLDGYRRGMTPNPDILCNREIKFSALLNHCQEKLGAEYLATGHYAQLRIDPDGDGKEVQLLKGVDPSRDQTYFLASVRQSALRRAMFPLGGMMKRSVFELARAHGFEDIAALRESRGLCFIGKRKFAYFLSNYIEHKPGPVKLTCGKVIGEHPGVHTVTRGQQAILKYTNLSYQGTYFVNRRDPTTNTVHVVPDSRHPALYSSDYVMSWPLWTASGMPACLRDPHGVLSGLTLEPKMAPENVTRNAAMRRFSHSHLAGNGSRHSDDVLVTCSHPIRGVAPGQFGVFYQGDVCIGCAQIREALPMDEGDLTL
ncbi:mitochondrial tRNA-specific 2-thiouridylase 1-like [Sycon ciliatum]|uniref:mitochondrial tRNA-specific 2-thiouridylase 1-like n=1 Tax=Sycon ciliatum TaxID=27933 RepID=UPI0031F71906